MSGGSTTTGAPSSGTSGSQMTIPTLSYNFNLLKTWDTKNLDPANTSFAKQLSKESSFDSKEKYNLETKVFKLYHLKHVTNKETCSLHRILDIGDSTSTKQDLLTKHTLISESSVLENKNETWSAFTEGLNDDEKCKIHNCQIKSNMLGKFLLESLTDSTL